jgi:hypothetical protein
MNDFEMIGLGWVDLRGDRMEFWLWGHYSNGTLYQVTPQPQGQPTVTAIPIERPLENPDGISLPRWLPDPDRRGNDQRQGSASTHYS